MITEEPPVAAVVTSFDCCTQGAKEAPGASET